MSWEYRQMRIQTRGWIEIKVQDNYIHQLNKLAREGWEVDQMVPIHTGISGTSSIVILLKRPLD
ncbi:hypothetical protein AMJ86_01285 [bacterium SM23_57]|jgi:hypothetical protein|nr:MAG: hypothetical protein AMJ86_01285 [bacterium SM23_57]